MVTYTVERLADAQRELETLLPLHWREVAKHQDTIKLAPDWPFYYQQEASGKLHLLVVRAAGRMIGYHIAFVSPHPHYRHSLTASVDIYFVLPEYRKGRVGLRLFKEAEKSLKARGVQRILTSTKVDADKSLLFERLGYRRVEYVYSKLL